MRLRKQIKMKPPVTKAYSCTHCDNSYESPNSLRRHMNIHKNRYKCNFCEKCFTCPTNLLRHQRIHTGEKPFGCENCKYRTGDKWNLSRHKKVCKKKKRDRRLLKTVAPSKIPLSQQDPMRKVTRRESEPLKPVKLKKGIDETGLGGQKKNIEPKSFRRRKFVPKYVETDPGQEDIEERMHIESPRPLQTPSAVTVGDYIGDYVPPEQGSSELEDSEEEPFDDFRAFLDEVYAFSPAPTPHLDEIGPPEEPGDVQNNIPLTHLGEVEPLESVKSKEGVDGTGIGGQGDIEDMNSDTGICGSEPDVDSLIESPLPAPASSRIVRIYSPWERVKMEEESDKFHGPTMVKFFLKTAQKRSLRGEIPIITLDGDSEDDTGNLAVDRRVPKKTLGEVQNNNHSKTSVSLENLPGILVEKEAPAEKKKVTLEDLQETMERIEQQIRQLSNNIPEKK